MEQAAASSSSFGPAVPPQTSSAKRKRPRRIYDVEDRTTKIDVGFTSGTSWTLSSYKSGSGVAELRSADLTKLWQSDGSQPHLINIQFSRRTCVTHLSFYLDVKQDDSYTPTKIAIKAGTNYHDLTLVRQRSFESPQGWKHFNMTPPESVDASTNEEDEEDVEEQKTGEDEEVGRNPMLGQDNEEEEGDDDEGEREGIRVWLIQVCILANHLNGKDTHIRRLIVFGPKAGTSTIHQGPNLLKRGPTNKLTKSVATSRARGAQTSIPRGPNVTLAQLLSIQRQTAGGAEDGTDDADGEVAPPWRTSALNLFGNIR
ncbi:related to anaphase promoting complex subunit 10 [Melanopsichium pennsylvanicum]|uniref:Related to anaphase promoting complex subunit 10 n=2 Tax=Melanopsichium pennsylvanicum TaxID=63383 RepID=A0AAJ4XKB6_9BASI|nr:related to anaphase promoting complex subunit 10 [Melanopsichium pennsylvanicum 4]SNX84080.1 related to anaphase promoting complex subunit 10 [Melanopsichium pennsylvanicum]